MLTSFPYSFGFLLFFAYNSWETWDMQEVFHGRGKITITYRQIDPCYMQRFQVTT